MDPVIEIRDTDTLRTIEVWIQAILGPLAFVYCAARIAPSHRKIAAIVFAVLVVVATTALAAWVNAHADSHRVEFGLFRFLLQVVGAVGAIYLVRNERENADKQTPSTEPAV